VKDFFPLVDHGSIMITSRLPNLQQHGSSLKLGIVDEGLGMSILSNTSRRSFTGKIILSLKNSNLGIELNNEVFRL